MATTFTSAQMIGSGAELKNTDPTKKPGRGQLHLRHITVDFDALATTSGQALATGDVYPLIPVDVGEVIISGGCQVLTVATAASDLDFGFTGGYTKAIFEAMIVDDADEVPTITAHMAAPIYVDTRDTLDVVTATQTLAGAVLRFWILVARF